MKMKFDAKNLEQFEQFVGNTKCVLELENSSGMVMTMELEPLESRHFGKIVYVQERMPKPKLLNPKEHAAGRPARYEDEQTMLGRLQMSDYDTWGTMMDLLKIWVKQSYDDIPDAPLNKLLTAQAPVFIREFMKLHSDIDDQTGEKTELKDFIAEKRDQLNEKTQEQNA